MKHALKLTAMLAAVLMLAACHKEKELTPDTVATTQVRDITYTVADRTTTVHLETDTEFEALLVQFCNYAQQGDSVTFYNANRGNKGVAAKDVATYSTTNREEMIRWMRQMEEAGKTVTVTYDPNTGSYNGMAYAPGTPPPDQTRVWPAGALLDGLYGSYYWENPETGLVERHAIEISEQILHVFISNTSDVNSFPEYFRVLQKINRGGKVSCVVTFSLTRRDAINMLKECPGVYDIEPVGYDRSDSHYPDHLKCFPNEAYLKPISPYTREEIQQLADSLNLIVEENSTSLVQLRADHSRYNIVAAANKFHDAALTKSTELLPRLLREGYNDF